MCLNLRSYTILRNSYKIDLVLGREYHLSLCLLRDGEQKKLKQRSTDINCLFFYILSGWGCGGR